MLKLPAFKTKQFETGETITIFQDDAKFWIFKFAQGLGESVDADAEAVFLKAITHLVQVKDAAVHRAAPAFWRIQTSPEPFEIRSFAAIHFDTQKTCGGEMKRVFRTPLDGLCKILRRNLTERKINSSEMFTIQRIELGVVRGAVLGAEPPAPVAPFGSQKRLVRFF